MREKNILMEKKLRNNKFIFQELRKAETLRLRGFIYTENNTSPIIMRTSALQQLGILLALIILTLGISSVQATELDCSGPVLGYQRKLCLKGAASASILSEPTAKETVVLKDITNHLYQSSIEYVKDQGIVKGNPDGNYLPDATINRAELTKILVIAKLKGEPPAPQERCFPDIEAGAWFEPYVCYAKAQGIVGGYPNGTFGPTNPVNFAEASKFLANTFSLETKAPEGDEPWYAPFISTLSDRRVIPGTISKHNHALTRGEMAEMIARIVKNDTSSPSLTACDFIPGACTPDSPGFGDQFTTGVNMSLVRAEWLKWYNTEREKIGLHAYIYNNDLNRSALLWSREMQKNGVSHKRAGQTAYYDYPLIKAWFNNLNLDFENVYKVTFSENIGAGPFSCSSGDCTQALTDAIKQTFLAYMAEKGTEDAAHYNSIMNKYFNEIGLGIVVDQSKGKFFLSVHYGTKLK